MLLLLQLGVLVDGKVVEGDVVVLGRGSKSRWFETMRGISTRLLVLLTEQQVIETVANLKETIIKNTRLSRDRANVVVHLHLLSQLSDLGLQVLGVLGMAKVDTHEELSEMGSLVLQVGY